MSGRYYRNTLVNVDLEAVYHNYKVISGIHPDKTFIAVVKGNAYGLGSHTVSDYLASRGVVFFAVATLDEAIDLRMHGIRERILVLGVISPKDINKAIQHRVAVSAPSLSWVNEAISNVTDKYDKEVWIHIKVNTGMNRYGTDHTEEIKEMIQAIDNFDRFIYEGVYSHLASADEDTEFSSRQVGMFEQIVSGIKRPEYVHIQNSAGTLRYQPDFCNAVRVGISLYGYYPSPYIKEISNAVLKPSVELVTHVADVHHLKSGDAVSYGAAYVARDNETIATLPIGYADGFIRKQSGYKVALESGESSPVVGKVCMDSTMIKVPEDTEVGDKVTVISQNQDSEQSMDVYSDHVETIPYESLCLLSRRIPRAYRGKDVDFVYNEVLK